MDWQIVVCELNEEQYGLNIASVESIIKMQTITRIPQSPGFVEGVTNLRGKVLPVIDLHKRFGITETAETKNSRIIVASIGGMGMGMIVDGVSEVLTISEEMVEPPPPLVTTVDSTFIDGIVKLEGRLVILLNLEKVLSVEEQKSLQALPSAG